MTVLIVQVNSQNYRRLYLTLAGMNETTDLAGCDCGRRTVIYICYIFDVMPELHEKSVNIKN